MLKHCYTNVNGVVQRGIMAILLKFKCKVTKFYNFMDICMLENALAC